ncbi:MAG TPA: glycosyltransferase family 4 protein, partial [bacterium]|nr:glycosyltransferase family 4 protein [bacterium]
FSFSPDTMRLIAHLAGFKVEETTPSPLVFSDIYGYTNSGLLKFAIALFAMTLDALSRILYALTGGRAVCSTSFVTVCRKEEAKYPVKVLHIITRLDRGGSAMVMDDIVTGIDKNKFETHLLCGSFNGFSDKEADALKNSCASFRIEPSLKRDPGFSDVKALFKLYGIIRKGGFDIVHTHTSKAGFIGRIAARAARVPVVIHSTHGHVFYGYFGSLKTKLFILLEKIGAHFCDAVLCLTELEIRDHLKLGIGRRRLFEVVHSGVDIKKFASPASPPSEVRAGLGIKPDATVIGTVARLDPVKGVKHLIDAFGIISSSRNDTILMIVGDGEERDALEALAADKGLSHRVLFLGFREDVPDLLHSMDIYVQPSLNEGYGKSIVEAMSAGLPIVASDVGGIPFLISNGTNGLLVPAGNSSALSDALEKIIFSEDMRKNISRNARESVSDIFSVENMIKKIEETYTRLLSVS